MLLLKFDILKDKKKVSEGNPLMLKTYTDIEIKQFYNRLGYDVEIKRERN